VANGSLTRREARNLQSRIVAIRRDEVEWARANGGHLTARQQDDLDARLKYLSDHIYIQKHDAQDRVVR